MRNVRFAAMLALCVVLFACELAVAAPAPAKDPVCGMEVDPAAARAAGRVIVHGGQTYFFCSDACRTKFQADPARFVSAAAAPPASSAQGKQGGTAAKSGATPTKDPVCGMEVDEAKARSAGRVTTHGGQTYFFCSDACKKKFDADPAHYVTASLAPSKQAPASAGAKAGPAAARDPVCGMAVDEAKARAAGHTATHDGQTYFFCSEACKKKFQANPAQYVTAGKPAGERHD